MNRVVLCAAMVFALIATAADTASAAGSWQQSEHGYRYQKEDGQATVNAWIQDQGEWYYFDHDGYMDTGWVRDKEAWYYTDSEGRMLNDTNQTIHGIDFQFDQNGDISWGKGPDDLDCPLAGYPFVSPAAYWSEDGNVFVNEWSNYQITFPESYNKGNNQCVNENEDFHIYDSSDKSDSSSYVLDLLYGAMYEDTMDFDSDCYQHTPTSYLESWGQSFLESVEYGSVSEVEDTVLGDIAYKKISALYDDQKMDVYCRQIGHYMMILMTNYNIGSEEDVGSILDTMRKVNN